MYKNNCSICNKERSYKSYSGFQRANKKQLPCRSCSNSIQHGNNGNLYHGDNKLCTQCNVIKPLFDFFKYSSGNTHSFCKSCSKEKSSIYHKKKYRFKKYGIDENEYLRLMNIQNNKCKICNNKLVNEIHIDHCHSTNNVRGILCGKCNKGLGQFEDNVEFLTNAIKYLKNE